MREDGKAREHCFHPVLSHTGTAWRQQKQAQWHQQHGGSIARKGDSSEVCSWPPYTAPERDVLFEPLHDTFSFKNMRTLVNLLGSYLDKKYQVWIRNIIHLF